MSVGNKIYDSESDAVDLVRSESQSYDIGWNSVSNRFDARSRGPPILCPYSGSSWKSRLWQ